MNAIPRGKGEREEGSGESKTEGGTIVCTYVLFHGWPCVMHKHKAGLITSVEIRYIRI